MKIIFLSPYYVFFFFFLFNFNFNNIKYSWVLGKNIMLILHRRLMSLHCIEKIMQVKEYFVVRYFVF